MTTPTPLAPYQYEMARRLLGRGSRIAKRESLRRVCAVTDRLEPAIERVEEAERRLCEFAGIRP
jgi:hypothetical protein